MTAQSDDEPTRIALAVAGRSKDLDGADTAEDTKNIVVEPESAHGVEQESTSNAEDAESRGSTDAAAVPKGGGRRRTRIVVFGVLPVLALLLAAACGYLKWRDGAAHDAQIAGLQALQTAKDSTVSLLSYGSDTVDQQLAAASNLLTGDFRESYAQLTRDVVIPGAKQKNISTVATVPAGAVVSSTPHHAVVLVFVNQAAIVDKGAPTDTASTVRVTLDKVGDRWLISAFDPV